MNVTVLLWLALPLAATIAAIAWAYVASRPTRPAESLDSMRAYARFRAAMTSTAQPPADSSGRSPRR